jgi:1,2-phenylacetyl-CoA epoxidase catalytic subunit
MQSALDQAWPFVLQLFSPLPDEAELTAAGLIPPSAEVRAAWADDVQPFLQSIGLVIPAGKAPTLRRDQHTEHLAALLTDMQSVARLEAPDTPW